MTRHLLSALLLLGSLALLAGCIDDRRSGGNDDPCGDGLDFTWDQEDYCLYGSGILEEGFQCPADLARRDFDGFTACGPEGGFGNGFEGAARDHGHYPAPEPNNGVSGDCADITDITDCDEAPNCRYAAPGCDADEPNALRQRACLPAGLAADGSCASSDECPDGTTCTTVWEDPCLQRPGEDGGCEACGSDATLCIPNAWIATEGCEDGSCCAALDQQTCTVTPGCDWQIPGCATEPEPLLPQEGCYPAHQCTPDLADDCPADHHCQEAAVVPDCALSPDPEGNACDACAVYVWLCVPRAFGG